MNSPPKHPQKFKNCYNLTIKSERERVQVACTCHMSLDWLKKSETELDFVISHWSQGKQGTT